MKKGWGTPCPGVPGAEAQLLGRGILPAWSGVARTLGEGSAPLSCTCGTRCPWPAAENRPAPRPGWPRKAEEGSGVRSRPLRPAFPSPRPKSRAPALAARATASCEPRGPRVPRGGSSLRPALGAHTLCCFLGESGARARSGRVSGRGTQRAACLGPGSAEANSPWWAAPAEEARSEAPMRGAARHSEPGPAWRAHCKAGAGTPCLPSPRPGAFRAAVPRRVSRRQAPPLSAQNKNRL